jgi:hypothetical protein
MPSLPSLTPPKPSGGKHLKIIFLSLRRFGYRSHC